MEIKQKVAYIKGLMEGLSLADSGEKKVLELMVELLSDICDEIEGVNFDTVDLTDRIDELEDDVLHLESVVEEIDEDLGNIEEEVYGDLDDEEGGCGCGGHHHHHDIDDQFYSVVCPTCEEQVYLDSEMLEEGEINCPACGELLEFSEDDIDVDFDEIEDEDTAE